MNQTRRELLKFIGSEIRTTDGIKKEFDLEEDQIRYHLSMLMQSLYVIESHEGWKSTPRGIGFLENAIMDDN
jgi:predicted transcriptional regulator